MKCIKTKTAQISLSPAVIIHRKKLAFTKCKVSSSENKGFN